MSSFEPAAAGHEPAVPAPEVEPQPSATGAAGSQPNAAPVPETAPPTRVAAAVAELDRLSDLELADHPDLYQHIHTELQGALSAIDDA
jgi:hypothetical protein